MAVEDKKIVESLAVSMEMLFTTMRDETPYQLVNKMRDHERRSFYLQLIIENSKNEWMGFLGAMSHTMRNEFFNDFISM